MTDPLRVLLLVTNLGIGGAQRQVLELARGLDKTRFQLSVATIYSGYPLESDAQATGDVPVVSLRRRNKVDFSTLPKLVSLLRRQRIQIIQPYMTPAAFFGLTAAAIARTPIRIATERNGAYMAEERLGTRLYTMLERRLVRGADMVVPNSQAGRRHALSLGVRADRVRVIYNGLHENRFAVADGEAEGVRRVLGVPAGAPLVGIVGRLDDAKDHETFLRSAAILLSLQPDAWFVIVGDGHLRQRLEERARGLGIAERVRFAGSQVRIAPFIATFDAAVLSSSDDEGCSNFILEAMAMGKPVVCTDIGGNREVVTNGCNGLMTPAKDPVALARATAQVLMDSDLSLRLAEAGRQTFYDRFSQTEMVGRYEDLYEEMWARYQGKVSRQVQPVVSEASGPKG